MQIKNSFKAYINKYLRMDCVSIVSDTYNSFENSVIHTFEKAPFMLRMTLCHLFIY